MATNYLRDAEIAKVDVPLIEDLFEKAPIYESWKFQPTNDGMRHVVERVKSADAAQVVELDGALPEITSDTTLEDVRIGSIGGIMKAGEDAVKLSGGAAKYFGKKLSPVLKRTGENLEKRLIDDLLAYADANGNQIDAGGTNSGGMTSIIAVKMVEDETAGLYDPNGFGDGKTFDVLPLNASADKPLLMTIDSVEKPGFAQRVKMYMGLLLKNPDNVASIVNIDLTASTTTDTGVVALPSEADMDDLLDMIKADEGGDSMLIMANKTQNRLGVYKGGRLEMMPADDNFRRRFKEWEGVKIVTTRNYPQTQTTVS